MQIEISQCSFSYGRGPDVLADFSMQMDRFPLAVLGPNGAGKSTLLSLLASQYEPDMGELILDGNSTANRRGRRWIRRNVGWLSQDVPIVPGLSVINQLEYAGWLRGLKSDEARRSSEYWLDRLDLGHAGMQRADRLSGGQKRRLGIAQALLGSPKILLLDEPFAGLDPLQRKALREVIAELRSSVSIIVSTHQTEDLYSVYEQAIVMVEGRLLFDGPAEHLTLGDPSLEGWKRVELAYERILLGAEVVDH